MRDWVVQPETWQGNTGPAGQGGPPHLMGSTVLTVGTYAVAPLTSWQPVYDPTFAIPLAGFTSTDALQRSRFPETRSRLTGLATRGFCHWHLEPWNGATWATLFGRAWRLIITQRITVTGQEPDLPTPVVPLAYDLSNYWGADDTFVWETQTQLINIPDNEWQGTSGQRTRVSGSTRVVASYRRSINKNECLAYFVSLEQDTNVTSFWTDVTGVLRLRFTRRMRTYVRS